MDTTYYNAKLNDMIKDTYIVGGSDDTYLYLINEISEHISADCFALKVNDEVIFNTNKEMSLRDSVLEKNIRNSIADSPHSYIMSNLLRKQIDFTIEIYMFHLSPWKLVINYDKNMSTFYMHKQVSQQYNDRFGSF
jgi:hypothetical protein